MPNDIDTSLLRTFATIAETASVTTAARRLNLTQAAVSLRMKRLEEAVGLRLLDRGPRGISLTAEGERLIAHAREAVRVSDAFNVSARGMADGRLIRLGATPNVVNGWLPDLLRQVATARSAWQVSLLSAPSSVLLDAIGDGRLDLALVQVQSDDTQGQELHRERLVWVGAEGGRAARKERLPISIAHPLCSYRTALIAALEAHGCSWEAVPDTESFDARIALLRADAAIGAMQPSVMPSGLQIFEDERLPRLPSFSTVLHRADEARTTVRSFSRALIHNAKAMLAPKMDVAPI